MLATVTSKGPITIPKDIRTLLQIKPNDRVDFIIEEGRVLLTPVKTLKSLRGALRAKEDSCIDNERRQAKAAVGRRVTEEMK